MKDKEKAVVHLIQSSFGMADEQNLEEFEAAEAETTEEERNAGNWEALKKRIDDEDEKKDGSGE